MKSCAAIRTSLSIVARTHGSCSRRATRSTSPLVAQFIRGKSPKSSNSVGSPPRSSKAAIEDVEGLSYMESTGSSTGPADHVRTFLIQQSYNQA